MKKFFGKKTELSKTKSLVLVAVQFASELVSEKKLYLKQTSFTETSSKNLRDGDFEKKFTFEAIFFEKETLFNYKVSGDLTLKRDLFLWVSDLSLKMKIGRLLETQISFNEKTYTPQTNLSNEDYWELKKFLVGTVPAIYENLNPIV